MAHCLFEIYEWPWLHCKKKKKTYKIVKKKSYLKGNALQIEEAHEEDCFFGTKVESKR